MEYINARDTTVLFNNVPLTLDEWSSGTSYSKDDEVVFGSYEYISSWNPSAETWRGANLNKQPDKYSLDVLTQQLYSVYGSLLSTFFIKQAHEALRYVNDQFNIVDYEIFADEKTYNQGDLVVSIKQVSATGSKKFFPAVFECVATTSDLSPRFYADTSFEKYIPTDWKEIDGYWLRTGVSNPISAFTDFELPSSIINSANSKISYTPTPVTGTINVTANNTIAGIDFSGFLDDEWIYLSGFTDDANNGKFRIVSTTTAQATLDTTDLIIESGTGDEELVSTGIQLQLDASNTDTIGFFRVYGTEINIRLIDNDTSTLYEEFNISLIDESRIIDAYTYCFEPFIYIINALQKYANLADATLEVEITTRDGLSELSVLQLGKINYLGDTQYGLSSGIKSYSSISIDSTTGYKYLDKGDFDNVMDLDFYIPDQGFSGISQLLEDRRDLPTIYIGDENANKTIIYGIYEDFNILLREYNNTLVNIKIASL